MSEQLKPCPFCGQTPGIDYSDALDAYVVVCEDCPANQFDDRRGGAIATWNTRPLEDAKDAEISALREERRWIPVSERLPEVGQRVLVWRKGIGGAYESEYADFGFRHSRGVSHWMPMPSMLKETP